MYLYVILPTPQHEPDLLVVIISIIYHRSMTPVAEGKWIPFFFFVGGAANKELSRFFFVFASPRATHHMCYVMSKEAKFSEHHLEPVIYGSVLA